MKSWNYKEKFEDIIRLNNEIKKHLTEEELNKILSKDNEITNIEWIYNNKLKIEQSFYISFLLLINTLFDCHYDNDQRKY